MFTCPRALYSDFEADVAAVYLSSMLCEFSPGKDLNNSEDSDTVKPALLLFSLLWLPWLHSEPHLKVEPS